MILVNGEPHDAEGLSVQALVERMVREPRGIAVALDGEIVRRSEWPSTIVHEGARIEIVTAAAGG